MARAYGKVILLGEHAVVYGHPALAAGMERGATATARSATESCLVLGRHRFAPGEGDIGRAFAALQEVMAAPSMEVRAELELPAGSGLGASAALGVAVARAIVEAAFPHASERADHRERVMAATVAWERVFHGNPSGIDAAAAAQGGCLEFRRGRGPHAVFLTRPLELAIAIAGPPASTKAMVEALARRRDTDPAAVDERLTAIGALVSRGRDAAERGELGQLGELMDLNHGLLAELGISTPALDQACEIARRSAALGAKLTGSGGGGCVIALANGSPEPVLEAWRSAGLHCFATRIAGGGTEESS